MIRSISSEKTGSYLDADIGGLTSFTPGLPEHKQRLAPLSLGGKKMVSVFSIKEKELRDLFSKFGNKRHPLCARCNVRAANMQPDTCSISYAPKAWFTDGRVCPRLNKQEKEIYKKLRRGQEGA
jgi:hypothetical protein